MVSVNKVWLGTKVSSSSTNVILEILGLKKALPKTLNAKQIVESIV